MVNFIEAVYFNELHEIQARHLAAFEVAPNTRSDIAFLKDWLKSIPACRETTALVCDGAYYSKGSASLAREKKILLMPTQLTGQKTDPFLAKFRFNERGDEFLGCPGGAEPKTKTYRKETEDFYLSFPLQTCVDCDYCEECPVKPGVRTAHITVGYKQANRALMLKEMNSKAYEQISHFRNGIEAVCSQLKNAFGANKARAYGLGRMSICLSFKSLALHLVKLGDTWWLDFIDRAYFKNERRIIIYLDKEADIDLKWVNKDVIATET